MTAHSWQANTQPQADPQSMLLRMQGFSAAVDPRKPAAGLHGCRFAQIAAPSFEPLRVELTPAAGDVLEPHDVFLRGGDLAVSYLEQPAAEMRTQVYWRARHVSQPAVVATIELLVSVQTNRLDSSPALWTSSRIPAGQILQTSDGHRFSAAVLPVRQAPSRHEACGFLARLDGLEVSYAQMVHPADARSTQVLAAQGGGVEIRHELFSGRLEKGVILRARVLGVVLERANDEKHALRQFQEFLAAELPLTT